MKLKTTLKRKRQQSYRVRFNDIPIEHITYSSDEYDRGGIFSFSVLYKINPTVLQQSSTQQPKLKLNTSSLNQDDSSSSPSPQTPSDNELSPIKKPKLTINTNLMNGPLFLTQLTTFNQHQDDDNDFLVPMSAYS
ncbi:unnamed protein product [Cunninghamella blakesleeana]